MPASFSSQLIARVRRIPFELASPFQPGAFDLDDNLSAIAHLTRLADFLDQHPEFQRTSVEPRLPRWFARYFTQTLSRAERDALQVTRNGVHRYRFDVRDTLPRFGPEFPAGLGLELDQPFDHLGSTTIAGQPVLVGEPYVPDDAAAIRDCIRLAGLFRCPVTFDRKAFHFDHPSCVRLAVWYTLAPHFTKPTRRPWRHAMRPKIDNESLHTLAV